MLGKSDPYVKVEFGEQVFETKAIKKAQKEAVWDETAYFFLDAQYEGRYQLKLDKGTNTYLGHTPV